MSARSVRIVVGEGPSTRKGLLRFVLDGEGYDVVAEASTTAELARLMATHRPDVVVLDDGIGANAVGMINEMSPNTRVVLVWPGAVVPVGGAARVEPSRVLQDLGPTVERLTGQPSATSSGRGSALLESATNDPDTLSAMLLGGTAAIDEPIIEDREPAPVVILPVTPTVEHDELILNVPEAESDDDDRTGVAGAAAAATAAAAGMAVIGGAVPAAAAEAGETGAATAGAAAAGSAAAKGRAVGAQSALNRRLGNLALGGAAVASALVLALALGGARVPIDGVRGLGQPTISQAPSPSPTNPPTPGGEPGGGGQPPNGGNDNGVNGGNPVDTTGSTRPDVTLVSNESPAPTGPPEVGVDPGDIEPGSGNGGGTNPGSSSDTGDGVDDHAGGDSGDHDRGGGNDRDGGDQDNGGGNDGDGGDHDNGGGDDDADNPGHGGGGDDAGGNGNGGNGNGGSNGNGRGAGGGSGSDH